MTEGQQWQQEDLEDAFQGMADRIKERATVIVTVNDGMAVTHIGVVDVRIDSQGQLYVDSDVGIQTEEVIYAAGKWISVNTIRGAE
jgi:hypothetical protein